jgi:pimeloyl-ACP methyl ester carboxylesterase
MSHLTAPDPATASPQALIEAHEARGRRFTAAGVGSFVRESGTGSPVLLVHGASTSSFMYRRVLDELAARDLRGIAFDLPGQGLAARPPADRFDYTWTGLGRYCAAAVDALGLDTFHLVVHDIGGPIGFELAAAMPDRIRSLTLLNTLLAVDRFKVPLFNRPFRTRGIGELYLRSMTRTAFTQLGYRVTTDRASTSKAEMGAYYELLKRGDGGQGFLATMRGFELTAAKHASWRATLSSAPYPIAAVWGSEDRVLAHDREGAAIRSEVPLVDFRLVPARHFVAEQQPEAVAEQVAMLARRVY